MCEADRANCLSTPSTPAGGGHRRFSGIPEKRSNTLGRAFLTLLFFIANNPAK